MQGYLPVVPDEIPGLTMMVSFPSIPLWELNVALIVPDRSSNGAALSIGVTGAGSSPFPPNASDKFKWPYAGAVGSVIVAPNATYDKLNALASGLSRLISWDFVSSTELGSRGITATHSEL